MLLNLAVLNASDLRYEWLLLSMNTLFQRNDDYDLRQQQQGSTNPLVSSSMTTSKNFRSSSESKIFQFPAHKRSGRTYYIYRNVERK